jgi:hypothetical protein
MSDDTSISTWDVLRDLGFEPDEDVLSDITPGLRFDFGNFKLSAGCLTNLYFAEIVLFSGVLVTPRTLTDVSFELPRRLNSREQCAAWIVWYLDNSVKRHFVPAREVEWLTEGRENQNLLP